MDVERSLCSKIISTGQLEEAISKGVRAEHFANEACRATFLFVTEHARKYKTPPTIEAFTDEVEKLAKSKTTEDPMGDFELIHVDDSLDYLVDRFISTVKVRKANDAVLELAAACDDPVRAAQIDLEFLEIARNLATIVPSTQIARFSDMDKRIKEYERRKSEGLKTGIPFGFPSLDDWTGGIQPHELITVAGFTGLGKSTLMFVIAFNAYVEGYTPLFFSLEMEADAILRKFDAMASGLTYKRLKQLDLPDDQMKHWEQVAEKVRDRIDKQEIAIIDSIRNCTADHVFAETVRHKPDLVCIDYLSLMKPSNPGKNMAMWHSLTEITQGLKQNARTLKIPILAAAQTNRTGGKDGAELDNIGYSMSVVHDSDIVLGLYADDEMRENKEMEIRLRKNRDGRIDSFTAIWDHEHMDFRERTNSERFGKGGMKPAEAPKASPQPVEESVPAVTRKRPQASPAAQTPRPRPRPRPGS